MRTGALLCFITTAVVMGSPAALCVQGAAPDVATVVANVRRATGIESLGSFPAGVRLTGEGEFLDAPCTVEQIFDVKGNFLNTIKGPVGITFAFDGTTAWTRDIGGETTVLSLGDRTSAILGAGIPTHRWFAPGSPLEFKADAEHSGDGVVSLAFSYDEGRVNGRVEVSEEDWMPSRWTFETPPTKTTVELSGSVTLGGLTLPASVKTTSSNGTDNTFTVKELSEAPVFFRNPYEYLAGGYGDATFDAAVPAALEMKRAKTGHILVHPLIDGKDVGWFIFDTGAGITVLDTKTCDELKLERFASIPAMGVGGAAKSGLARVKSFVLGPVTITDQLVLDLNISFLSVHMGEKIAGIVGYPVMARCVVSVDMKTPAVSIFNPASFALSGGAWSPLYVYERHPCVDGEVEGIKGIFRLDTGAGGSTVTFHVPFTEQHTLLDGRETVPTTMGGVGGMVPARSGRVRTMTLGGHEHKDMKAEFATQATGVFADPYLAGNVGGALVSPFVVVFDYQNNRIAFVPRDE